MQRAEGWSACVGCHGGQRVARPAFVEPATGAHWRDWRRYALTLALSAESIAIHPAARQSCALPSAGTAGGTGRKPTAAKAAASDGGRSAGGHVDARNCAPADQTLPRAGVQAGGAVSVARSTRCWQPVSRHHQARSTVFATDGCQILRRCPGAGFRRMVFAARRQTEVDRPFGWRGRGGSARHEGAAEGPAICRGPGACAGADKLIKTPPSRGAGTHARVYARAHAPFLLCPCDRGSLCAVMPNSRAGGLWWPTGAGLRAPCATGGDGFRQAVDVRPAGRGR